MYSVDIVLIGGEGMIRLLTIRSLFQIAISDERGNPASRNLHASAARCADGRHERKTNGFVPAESNGILSIREACAQPASINGLKRSASLAVDGRRTRSGMRSKKPLPTELWLPQSE